MRVHIHICDLMHKEGDYNLRYVRIHCMDTLSLNYLCSPLCAVAEQG